jgi:hypothetical protein
MPAHGVGEVVSGDRTGQRSALPEGAGMCDGLGEVLEQTLGLRMSTISDVGKRQFRCRFVMGVPSSRRPWSLLQRLLPLSSRLAMDVSISLGQLAQRAAKLREAPKVPDTSRWFHHVLCGHGLRYRARIRLPARGSPVFPVSPCAVAGKRKREAASAVSRSATQARWRRPTAGPAGRQDPSISLLAAPSNSALTLRPGRGYIARSHTAA